MAYNPDPRFAADSGYWSPPVTERKVLYVPPPTPATAIPRDVSFENPYAPYMEPVASSDMAPALYQPEAPPEGAPEARRGVLGAFQESLRSNPFQWGQIASNLARGGGPSREKRGPFQELGSGIRGALSADSGVARAADMRVADNREAKAAAAEQAKAAEANMRMMQNAILADPNLDAAAKQYYMANPKAYGDVMSERAKGPDYPASVEAYNFALDQFKRGVGPDPGSFSDFDIRAKKAGATTVDARQMGTVPPGYKANYDEAGNVISLEPIPGGPVAAKAAAEEKQAGVGVNTEAAKASTMLDVVKDAKRTIKDADTPVTGTLSRPFALYSGSPAGRLRSYVGALQSGVALQTMQRLKEASATGATGFGALSAPELQLLIDSIGALNPDNTEPDIFIQTLDRIEAQYQRVLDDIRKNVAPERIKELGLEPLLSGAPMATPAGPAPVYTSPSGVKVFAE